MASWWMKARYYEACNCAHGCPCNFNGFPTDGTCHGAVAFAVDEGERDGVDLAGLKVAAAVMWPGAIHEGNGECLPILDKRANESQIQALASLLGGKAGGPWGIIAATLTKVHEPKVVEWHFEEKGAHSTLRAGDVFELELTPMTNPTSGEPFEAFVKLPDGFISRELAHSSSRTFKVSAPLSYAYPGKDAAYGHFDYEGVLAG